MKPSTVQAPASLLLNPDLTSTAKLIWLVNRLTGPCGPALLQASSGLSRPTILKGLAQLTTVGWYTQDGAVNRAPAELQITVPGDLLTEKKVGTLARLLYGLLQLVPEFHMPDGRTSYNDLTTLTGCSRDTIKIAIRSLFRAGWLKVSQAHQHAPLQFELRDPVAARAETDRNRAVSRYTKAQYKGEALMREYLSLLIDSDQFEDDANPGFLVNPLTGELLQFDRFYPPNVAFEFNGPQHDGPTELFPDQKAFRRQLARDWMKAGACQYKQIQLVIVRAEDLSLAGMQRKVGSLLPLRDLKGQERLIAFLEKKSRRHRQAAV